MAVVFLDVFPVPYGQASFLSFFFLAFLVGFVVSPFRGVGVGFEEPHPRLHDMFYVVGGIGFPRISLLCIYGSSEWAT